jgi:hypothetical protein
MIAFLSLFVHLLVSPFKTQAQLEAEIDILRHQLNVLRRWTFDACYLASSFQVDQFGGRLGEPDRLSSEKSRKISK